MGGSGGGGYSRIGSSRGGGGGLSSGSGGGSSPPPVEDCPETRTTILVDVVAAGNGAHALALQPGVVLELDQDGNRFRVSADGLTLGWLPGDLSSLLRRCVATGDTYTASLQSVAGAPPSPQIRVVVQRV